MPRKKQQNDNAQIFGLKHDPLLFQTRSQMEYKNWKIAPTSRKMPEGGKTKSQIMFQCVADGQGYYTKKNTRDQKLAAEVNKTLREYKKIVPERATVNPLSTLEGEIECRFSTIRKPTTGINNDIVAAGKPAPTPLCNPLTWQKRSIPPPAFESAETRSLRTSGQLETCKLQRTGAIDFHNKNILNGPRDQNLSFRGLRRKTATAT